MGFFDRFKKKPTSGPQKPPSGQPKPIARFESKTRVPIKEMTYDQVTAGLEKLDYFAYTDPADQNQVKDELGKGLAEEHFFPFIEVGRPRYGGIDSRQYILDNETLFEQGGIMEALENMAPLFTQMNIRMEISDHIEESNLKTGTNQRITLNGKPYIIFDKWDGYGWGESAQRFADIINDQLALQNSIERLYLIQGAEDGRGVFLTPEQYAFVRPLIGDLKECPLPTQEWCKVWGVKWENVTS